MIRRSVIPAWKRIFDIAIAFVALVLASPLMLLVTAAVRLLLGRPVLFRQQRPGLGGRPFILYKFRTMRQQNEASNLEDALRLTPFGTFLRQTSLDELPELWNVLRGDMSLVGPRPLLVEYLNRYSSSQKRRHEVLPGITGWAQVNGRNAISWEQRFALDLWYVDHQSLWLDLKILFLSIPRFLKRDGIHAPGHPTMPEFAGSAAPGQMRQTDSDSASDASLPHGGSREGRKLQQPNCGEAQ